MATLSVRMPDSLLRQLKSLTQRVSRSTSLINTAVAEKMSVLLTVDYLETLAERGDRTAYESVLAEVSDQETDPWDRWHE